MNKLMVIMSCVFAGTYCESASFRDCILTNFNVDIERQQLEPNRRIKLDKPFAGFECATVLAAGNGGVFHIECIRKYDKGVDQKEIVPDIMKTLEEVKKCFAVSDVYDVKDASCYLRKTILFKDSKWYASLSIEESKTQRKSDGYYRGCLSFIIAPRDNMEVVATFGLTGTAYANAIQEQILVPMSKDEAWINADAIAFRRLKPLFIFLKSAPLQENEKIFLTYLDRLYQAGEKEGDEDCEYKQEALNAFAPLIVKLERRNIKLPEDQVAIYKKWLLDDAMVFYKLAEMRDYYSKTRKKLP